MIAGAGAAPGSRGGHFAANLMHFARLLRRAGLPIGPGRIVEALRTVEAVGLENRDDFYWALHAVFVNRREQSALFDQAFRLFWREPRSLEEALAALLPSAERRKALRGARDLWSRRVGEAWTPPFVESERPRSMHEVDAAMTYSDREILRSKDFAEMSAEEVRRAERVINRMRLQLRETATRRMRPQLRGPRVDMRATLRGCLRAAGDDIPLRWRGPKRRPPPLVVLCDISGSMARYTRMLLHFLHALANGRERVHCFLFATRLTNITRFLRDRDVDLALAKLGKEVRDWSGGTRIGRCLKGFNLDWSRRVQAQGAPVLLISDGLDRDPHSGLEQQMERLRKSCRRLIWLNPLLCFEGFKPRALGVRAILPYVDEFRPVHNLSSLEELSAALGSSRK